LIVIQISCSNSATIVCVLIRHDAGMLCFLDIISEVDTALLFSYFSELLLRLRTTDHQNESKKTGYKNVMTTTQTRKMVLSKYYTFSGINSQLVIQHISFIPLRVNNDKFDNICRYCNTS